MCRFCVHVVVSSFFTLWLCGCAEQSSQLNTGTVRVPGDELAIGSRLADFEFTDQECKIRSLVSFRGQFTIVAFTSCEAEYNPALTHLADFVEARSDYRVRIAGVDVFWTTQAKSSDSACQVCQALPEYGNPNFLAINDRDGTIRKRYGVKEPGRYFLIGPLGKVVAKGDIQDIDQLQATLDCFVDQYLREKEMYSKEIRS